MPRRRDGRPLGNNPHEGKVPHSDLDPAGGLESGVLGNGSPLVAKEQVILGWTSALASVLGFSWMYAREWWSRTMEPMNRIEINPAICSGKPVIRGTRIMVRN